METYDVFFTPTGIELHISDDNGNSHHIRTIPHIPASESMARGIYGLPYQERDISKYLQDHGLSIHGIYANDTTATVN